MTVYVVDTSVWINAWRYYPPTVPLFRPIWTGLATMIADGRLVSPDEVRKELKRGNDDAFAWTESQSGLYHPLDGDLQARLSEVMARFPDLVDANSDKSAGDPFVVALAELKSGAVVTDENPRRHPTARPKIPDACDGMKIRCIKLLGFLNEPEVIICMSPS